MFSSIVSDVRNFFTRLLRNEPLSEVEHQQIHRIFSDTSPLGPVLFLLFALAGVVLWHYVLATSYFFRCHVHQWAMGCVDPFPVVSHAGAESGRGNWCIWYCLVYRYYACEKLSAGADSRCVPEFPANVCRINVQWCVAIPVVVGVTGICLVHDVAVVQKFQPGTPAVQQALRAALAEMRMLVNSADGEPQNLSLMMGELRSSIELQVVNAGLQLVWDVPTSVATPEIPVAAQLHVTRILQECVANVIKHANASTITVQIKTGEGDQGVVEICIIDDGVSTWQGSAW